MYSNNGLQWQAQAPYIPFSEPKQGGGQEVFSMAYGAGTFVILGHAEKASATLNTVLAATNPISLTGLGKDFFVHNTTSVKNGRKVIYSERLSLFVLCGAAGNQGGTSLVWSVNPIAKDLTPGSNGNSIGMFDHLCMDVAMRSDIEAPLNGAATGQVMSTAVISRAESLSVNSTLSVMDGDLKSGGQLTVAASGAVNCSGSVYFSGTTRIVQGAVVTAGIAAVAFPFTSVLEIDVRFLNNSSNVVVVPLFSYQFAVGNFSTIRSINNADSCSVLGPATISYGPSTASALVTVNSESCGGSNGSLSTEAIIGIVVGSVVGGVALAIAIVVVSKALIAHHTATMKSELKMEDMQNLKP